jgi:hypothetical protein
MELRIVIAASALAVAGLVLAGLAAAALGAAKAAAKWPSADQPALGVIPARIGLALGVMLCAAAAGLGASMAPISGRPAWLGAIAGAAIIVLVLTTWAAVKLASKIELSALINSPSPMAGDPQTAMSRPGSQPSVAIGSPIRHEQPEIAYGQPYPGMVEPPPLVAEPSPPAGSPAAFPDIPTGPQPVAYVDAVHTTTRDTAVPAMQNAAKADEDASSDDPRGDQADAAVPAEALPGWVYTDEADDWYLVASIPQGRRLMRLSDFSIVPPGSVVGALTLAGSVEMTVWPADADATATQERPGEAVAEPH